MQIINTSISSPSDTLSQLALYSGMDVLSLFEIKDGLSKLMDENRWKTYEFEMELQSPLLAMSLVGIPVDEAARREMTEQFTKEQKQLTLLINQMLDAIGYFDYYRRMAIAEFSTYIDFSPLPSTWDEWLALPLISRRALKEAAPEALEKFQKTIKEFSEPFNPVSPAQKLRLFYHFFGSPDNISAEGFFFSPPWLKTYGLHEHKTRNTKNEYTPAADREALEKIIKAAGDDSRYAAYWAAPFAHVCLAISDLSKSLGFLKCKLEHGLFKASFGAVTETGRLSSRQNAQGYGSNAQNVAPKLRHIFVAPPGEKFIVVDYAQIESRIVAAICYRLFGLENYIAATESGDLHSLAASMVWPDLPWPKDFTIECCIKHGPFPKDMLKAAKKLASNPFYRGKSRRDVSKTLGHGTSYCGKPPQMSKHSHIEVKLIEHYQQVFFEAFPEIAKWHRWVVEQVQTKGEIITMLGRARRFFGRPNDDSTIREAVAYEPQSVAADYCNNALLRLHKLWLRGEFPATIRLSKHDELVVTCNESLEERVLEIMREQMEEHITLVSPTGEKRNWFVPAECESGWNLGRKSDSNPNGIGHPLDGRKRVETGGWREWKF
ncbi:MAG: hypothetical protein IPP10_15495 [Candidatus Competibacteraceae bacterium]|nr:hypothetical protein [Candidatus Competibacteraceae bacterium]